MYGFHVWPDFIWNNLVFGIDSDKVCMKSLIAKNLCWFEILLRSIHYLTVYLKVSFEDCMLTFIYGKSSFYTSNMKIFLLRLSFSFIESHSCLQYVENLAYLVVKNNDRLNYSSWKLHVINHLFLMIDKLIGIRLVYKLIAN